MFSSVSVCVHPGASETERRLHQKLFKDYNMKVRPARYWEDKVMVRVGMTLSQLVSLVNTGARVSFIYSAHTHCRACLCQVLCSHPFIYTQLVFVEPLSHITRYGSTANAPPPPLLPCLSSLVQNEKNEEMTTNVFMNLVRARRHPSSSPSLARLV